MPKARVTERTFYPAMIEAIRGAGGSGVQEVSYNSEPDIQFELGSYPWLLSVKIGHDPATIKGAMLQYLRHKEESKIDFGLLVLLPESFRKVSAQENAVRLAIRDRRVSALVDAATVKEELRDRAFPDVLRFIRQQVLLRLKRGVRRYYSLPLVISLLQRQVSEMMDEIDLGEDVILRIITDRKLLMDLGHLDSHQAESAGRFLASYILLSQILFFRLLYSQVPTMFPEPITPISEHTLRRAFGRILDRNYRPIYLLDVLDAIPEKFIKDTFDLIWGLEIENIRYELPGRVFHELMPKHIRKMLAAFYTRPQAADILASLTIRSGGERVLDPACGSGTILASAYRHKLGLTRKEHKMGNPHRRFCEEEIFGADIMPFAVHLTSANLSAMDPKTTIERTQVMQCDSLTLAPEGIYESGLGMLDVFPVAAIAADAKGGSYEVELPYVDSVVMNPPFTKVERGIFRFVNMKRFQLQCGGEIGLWGHFLALSDVFVREGGSVGAVIPINFLRGRESEKVRGILLKEWTPLYIVKCTRNYGFSEWAEYRDILFVARKKKPRANHQVKFCLVKSDLTQLTEKDSKSICSKIIRKRDLRSPSLDVMSTGLSDMEEHFSNLMWFCGVTDLSHRDILVSFIDKFSDSLESFPADYFREGYRPVPKGVSKFLFLTRHSEESRVREAWLRFAKEGKHHITCLARLGASYKIEKNALTKSLRTPVGLKRMDISEDFDYIAHCPYAELKRVCRAVGFEGWPARRWSAFWSNVESELPTKDTNLVVCRRINPFSPSTHLAGFYSDVPLRPSNQVNVMVEPDLNRAKAVCTLLNSTLFWAYFFLLKEESTGRYIDVRFYDLNQMKISPRPSSINKLVKVFEKFRGTEFPSLRRQFDIHFVERYKEFWEQEDRKTAQRHLWTVLDKPIKPTQDRVDYDLAVSRALGVDISPQDLAGVYGVVVKEMIITRHLKRD